MGVFLFAWNTRNYAGLPFLIFLGITYFYTGSLDLLHTLSYKGMQIFTGYDYYANQLWIAARFMESVSLFVCGYLVRGERRYSYPAIHAIYMTATLVFITTIFIWRIFPECFIDGVGQTPFKIVSEYVIIGILVITLWFMIRNREKLPLRIFRLLTISIILTIFGELAFTFYIDNYGFSNLVGHYLKIGSFYLIYKAIIETGLKRPFDVVFKRLVDRERELQVANATKDKFFSIIAHDLRNPIGGIHKLSNMLCQELSTFSTADLERSLTGIRDSSARTYALLEDLLQWAQSQTGRLEWKPRNVDLGEILETTVPPIQILAEEKELQIIDQTSRESIIYADPMMLSTILRNLLSNAVKFTPSEGRITISSAQSGDGMIRLSVTDTGVGIPAQDQVKLFKIDNHISTEGTAGESGTGLGLILCKELVERNQGSIGFETGDLGTTFWFTVPTGTADA